MNILVKCLLIFLLSVQTFAGELTQLAIGVTKEAEDCTLRATKGDVVSVHYVGKLRDTDEVFDSSYRRGVPIQFTLGYGHVIEGWDRGIMGMCVGEERKLQIPSVLAYGERGIGYVIPPDSDLVFETELVDIQRNDIDDEL